VEVADLGAPGVGVRDSEKPEAGTLTVSPLAYAVLVAYVSG
jgi:hypothetical protein